MNKYPDTPNGARKFVEVETPKSRENIKHLEADPWVDGVWKVTFKNPNDPDMIIYMGGYKDPYGTVRCWNDFE